MKRWSRVDARCLFSRAGTYLWRPALQHPQGTARERRQVPPGFRVNADLDGAQQSSMNRRCITRDETEQFFSSISVLKLTWMP